MNSKLLLGVGLSTLLFNGCQTNKVGPRALRTFQKEYNSAVASNSDEQLLLNIVRLRYRDNPVFMEAGNIVQTNAVNNTGDATFDKSIIGKAPYSGKFVSKFALVSNNQSTLTFTQIKGRDFVQKMMTPIQLPIVVALLQSGWRAERVLNLCVERINNLYNAPTADGPTPEFAPEFKDFYRFSSIFSRLEENHVLEFGEMPDTNFSDLYLRIANNPAFSKEITEFKSLAGLSASTSMFKMKSNFIDASSKKLIIRGRTLLGMFFCLSHGVEVPREDRDAGLVTVTRNLDGTSFDWRQITKPLITVHCSDASHKMRPAHAFVSCYHRGHWFYIDDDDTTSKSTFMLITQIFTLQSSKYKSTEPILVIGN